MTTAAKPDFIKMEQDILVLWNEHNCFNKLLDKNKAGKRFRFLDGPITANNPMGIHHAWGRSTKDIFLRYKAMNGYSSHYQNGFDAQGLWVEVEVEKELGFKDKKDIESYGMDNFTRKCVERVKRYSHVITEQSKRLGQWMDWDNSYFTHTDNNILAIWHFLKICHKNGWIAKAYRPMPWCPRCGTSLSEHEMSGSYKEITHTAVFAIAKMKNADFDALVWTTTPWTLSANVTLAVNPELDYALVKCEGFCKPLVMAKNAIKHIDGEKQVLRLLKGEELVGIEYETFFPWLLVQGPVKHRVIPWGDVGADEGSGIVHIAPGCGAEDYDLGKAFSLSEICPIDESGVFMDEYDFLAGKTASQAAVLVFEKLSEQGKLYKTHDYTHNYPVCWRCKTEVLFRLVREWYIKTDEVKPRLIEAANTVQWEPPFIGKRMLDWLNNMGDWNISRKRFYGLPLPFYPCESCGHLTVVGSKDELVELGGTEADNLPELHRPWVDEVIINCPQCGETVSRIPEVGDVWLDAGIAPFSTLGYFTNTKEWEQNFPAEWVIEMQEQVRLWFYSQLFMSVTITGKAPYERVHTNNWVLAEDGTKFSKTGYMIRFDEVADRMGADAARYLFAGASMMNDVRFGFTLGEEARRKLLGFWNIYTFFMTYAEIDKPGCMGSQQRDFCPETSPVTQKESANLTDMWLTSRVSAFVSKAAKAYENYNTSEVVREFELCVDDVSNWYVRINRRRFWKEALDADKQSAYSNLYQAIKEIAQVMAPIIPFMTEYIWQNMTRLYEPPEEESIHLSNFPCTRDFDTVILDDVEKVRTVIAQALKLRNERNLKVRQPLSVLYLGKSYEILSAYEPVIRDELNIKEITYLDDFDILCNEYAALNFQVAGGRLKGDINKVKSLIDSLTSTQNAALVNAVKHNNAVVIEGYDCELSADCFIIAKEDKADITRSADSPFVAINTEITPNLKAEGLYRELLRHCQLLRKEAGFAISDKVNLSFETSSEAVRSVLAVYAHDIERETLSEINDIHKPVMQVRVDLDGGIVVISIA
ncbi:MAG: isoleucine--tRNA ligase [Defluviitaleaceae bacterium]|nr:isoleucine--tRNA ligase [Defluviitaleaceae bacterium]